MNTNGSSQKVRQDFLPSLKAATCDVESLVTSGEQTPRLYPPMEENGVLGKLILQDMPLVSVEDNLIAFGIARRWFFLRMEEKGVLKKPVFKGNWVYRIYDANSITLPPHAQKRLDAVNTTGFPIRQFIYGEEIKVGQEVKPRPKPHIPKPQIQISDGTLKTVTTVATAALALTVGAAMVVGYAFLLALSGIDPRLIAVVDPGNGNDESELPWILLDSWEK